MIPIGLAHAGKAQRTAGTTYSSWEVRDFVQPTFLGYVEEEEEFWDYGALVGSDDWLWQEEIT